MNRVRLLPIVIVAASGLFVLKTTALVSSGGQIFADSPAKKPILTEEDLPRFGRVLARMRFTPPPVSPGSPTPVDGDITGSVPGKKDAAAKDDMKKEEMKKAEMKKDAEQKPPPVPPPTAASSAERAVLERLQERRGAIDERNREIDLRESLLQAAERKLDGRINELKDIEGRLDAGAKNEQAEADKQVKSVVTMYESMKPKDAARVFDRLNLQVLVPIATAMKPARMSEILAVMNPEAAERLTVALATRGREPAGNTAAANKAPAGELPRIDTPPGRPRR